MRPDRLSTVAAGAFGLLLAAATLVATAAAAGAQDTTTTTEVRRMVGEPLPIWVTLVSGAVLFVVILVVGNLLRQRIVQRDQAEAASGGPGTARH